LEILCVFVVIVVLVLCYLLTRKSGKQTSAEDKKYVKAIMVDKITHDKTIYPRWPF
jgi:hypothetical protein